MDTKQDQAVNRLLKKLSSLRATLKNDERIILDELITGSPDEVTAHSMNVKAVNPAKTPTRTTAPDEAVAHSMNVKAVNPAKTPTRTTAPDEAVAHSMNVKAVNPAKTPARTTAADEAVAHAMSIRIVYDPTKDEYQRVS
jgi:hypothetical protein